MNNTNIIATISGIVAVTLVGSITYFQVVSNNNNKEIVTRAIERGLDPTTAACASRIGSNSTADIRATCEKLAIIKGK